MWAQSEPPSCDHAANVATPERNLRFHLRSVDHLKNSLVGVAEQHARITVATDRGHLWRAQAHLEEAAQSLVAEIVEVEVSRPARRLRRSQASLKALAAIGNTRVVL
jgi:hypothetical protein